MPDRTVTSPSRSAANRTAQDASDISGSASFSTFATGSVELTELNTKAAAAGTQEAIDKAMAELKAGTLKVFDTKNWTKDGQHLTEYLADVQDMGDFKPETNVIIDGAFIESGEQFRSAPYFDIRIDGIDDNK